MTTLGTQTPKLVPFGPPAALLTPVLSLEFLPLRAHGNGTGWGGWGGARVIQQSSALPPGGAQMKKEALLAMGKLSSELTTDLFSVAGHSSWPSLSLRQTVPQSDEEATVRSRTG